MSCSRLQKQRYLDILSSGVFARFGPAQMDSLHKEVGDFLKHEFSVLDPTELFDIYELQFYLLLLTNHDIEAKSYLDRFNDQFAGKKSQRIMVLRLMYLEATGDRKAAMEALGTDPDELRASRRLATFARTNKNGSYNAPEYIKALNFYLNLQPADPLAWAELGDVYSAVGHYDKAVFCFKEVLLHNPGARNFFYKAGLNLYLQHLYLLSLKPEKKEAILEIFAVLEHARDCFLRCVEYNETHTKSWLGVYLLAKSPLLVKASANKSISSMQRIQQVTSEFAQLAQLCKLHIMKTQRLDETALEAFLKSGILEKEKGTDCQY